MKKLLILATAVILALGMCGTALAASPIVIKLAHPNVPAHPMGEAFELFKSDLEKRSGGAFRVEIYDSSKYGNFDAVVQGLQMGVLQMGSDAPNNLSVFNPSLMLFDMPYIINSYEESDLITDGPIGQELKNSLLKNNIIGLGYIEIGFRNIFSSKPVRTLEDAKGLKIRATHSKAHIAILQSQGMNPTPVAWGEVYTALQQKTVDAVDIDLNLAYFNKFHEVVKYVTMTRSFYSPHLVMMSKTFWDKLTPDQRRMVEESFAVAQAFEREAIRKNEAMILEKIVAEGGEVIELSPEESARFMKAAQGIPAQFSKEVPPALVQQIRDTINAAK